MKKSACGSGLARDISTQSCIYRGQGRSHNEKFASSEFVYEKGCEELILGTGQTDNASPARIGASSGLA